LTGYLATISINTPVLAGGLTVIAGGLLFLAIYKPPHHLLHQDMEMPGPAGH